MCFTWNHARNTQRDWLLERLPHFFHVGNIYPHPHHKWARGVKKTPKLNEKSRKVFYFKACKVRISCKKGKKGTKKRQEKIFCPRRQFFNYFGSIWRQKMPCCRVSVLGVCACVMLNSHRGTFEFQSSLLPRKVFRVPFIAACIKIYIYYRLGKKVCFEKKRLFFQSTLRRVLFFSSVLLHAALSSSREPLKVIQSKGEYSFVLYIYIYKLQIILYE